MEADLPSSAKLVGFCLAQYYIPGKETYPSQMTIAEDASIRSRNTVAAAIRQLEKIGMVTVVKKKLHGNSFNICTYQFICSMSEHSFEHTCEQGFAPSIEQSIAPSIEQSTVEHKVVKELKRQGVKKTKAKKEFSDSIDKPDDLSEQCWKDFRLHRKAKRAVITQKVLDMIRSEAEMAGISMEDAVNESISRGWQAFKADWYLKSISKQAQAGQSQPNWLQGE